MIKVDKKSGIPLFGLDFLGILDRGTNLLEIKPITLCNLRCKYCFVNARYGNSINASSNTNCFILDLDYLIHWLKIAIEWKKCDDLEIHIAPYGEFFLYPQFLELIRRIRQFPQVKTISIQTNGTLLTRDIISQLDTAGLTRLNISINTVDEKKAKNLSGVPHYDVNGLVDLFDFIIDSNIDLLIAPIWFFTYNDEDIVQIIEIAQNLPKQTSKNNTPLLGIQNYLLYKTGRKFRKVEPRTFDYFYSRLTKLEKQFDVKLKLGPLDFGIHTAESISPPVNVGEKISVKIICLGRSRNEYIGVLNELWAVKILSNIPLAVNKVITVTVIKQKLRENLITARFAGKI
jgi:uncharacterized Fe-S cluster-containing radical SAM superfamily enzyme